MEHTLQASHAEKLELVQDKLRLAEALCRATDMLAGMRPRIISEAGCPCRAETVCSSASGMPAGIWDDMPLQIATVCPTARRLTAFMRACL